MERREFFRSLIAGGAGVRQRPQDRNKQRRHVDEQLYRGPMTIPERVAGIVAEHPAIKKTTFRHLASHYSEGGITWVFRCQIPASRQMVGELVRTTDGKYRVHCWSVATPGEYRTPEELLLARRPDESGATMGAPPLVEVVRPAAPIMPPLLR